MSVPARGDEAPDVELVDDRGEPWHLRRDDGRPVVVILHRHFY